MKIALISHLFPTELHPFHGKFIKDQLSLLNSDEEITADLIVPTPYSFPFTNRNRKNTSSLLVDNFNGKRTSYLSFPKKRFPQRISRSLSNAIESEFQHKSYDIIHVHWLYPDGLCIPQLKKMDFKCVLTIHGSDWYQTKDKPVLMKLLVEVLQVTDRVLYSGPKLKTDMEDQFPWLAEKSDVIYNLVNTDFYTMPSEKKKASAVEKLNWDKEKLNVLTVANIRHEKGVDMLLEAVDDERFSDVHFHIIGSKESDNYGEQILEKINKAASKNVFLHNPVPPQELLSYYHAADFYVLPSRREGFNVSILEAMSTGLPVVATPVGGNREVVNEATGMLTREISTEEIKYALLKMIEIQDKYDRQTIREKISDRFGDYAFLERLIESYVLHS